MNEDCESAITDAKYGFISGALKETFTDNHLEQAQTTKVLDSIVTHRIWGYSPSTKVPSNIRYMKRKKIGYPQIR